MSTTVAISIAVIITIVAICLALYTWRQKRRTQRLRDQFGPEYRAALEREGDRKKAERELENRQKRVEALDIHALPEEERSRFIENWRATQARFVDNPAAAVDEADRLVNQVMQACGYPMGDFEKRAADISVNHPALVKNYRAAHDIANSSRSGHASTEDLRRAMVYYRDLFDDLLKSDRKATINQEQESAR